MPATTIGAKKPVVHPENKPITTIGKYTDAKEIAKGGMGAVYLATHPTLKREVIIKKLLIKRSGSEVRKRFEREAQILIDLSSPNVVRMFDYFSERNSDYIVLEYMDGMSLDKLLEKQFLLPVPLALTIFLDACRGLKAAHDKGIIHRDIKPANILISRKAEVKLADFGIAGNEKEADDPEKPATAKPVQKAVSDEFETRVGTVLGTPAYMSPEQLQDSSSVDKRTDIYSMGVMLYQMVTGDRPFKGDMKADTLVQIMKGKCIPPSRIVHNLPPMVCHIIKKMMRPNRNRRYQSIEPVMRKIRNYLVRNYTKQKRHEIREYLARSVRTTQIVRIPEFGRRYRIAKRVVLAALLVALLVGAWVARIPHRFLLQRWFVPVSLSLEVPSDVESESGHYAPDLPVKAFFFENDAEKDIPQVKEWDWNGSVVFKLKEKEQEERKVHRLSARTVYLRPGDYRIKLVDGPYVWWRSLKLEKGKPVSLDLDFLKGEKRTLAIHGFATDYDTGADISAQAEFKMLVGSKWLPLKEVKDISLASGKIFKIRAECEGYETEEFGLSIEWYQDSLFVYANLHKKIDKTESKR